jgi:hypothetical protein
MEPPVEHGLSRGGSGDSTRLLLLPASREPPSRASAAELDDALTRQLAARGARAGPGALCPIRQQLHAQAFGGWLRRRGGAEAGVPARGCG